MKKQKSLFIALFLFSFSFQLFAQDDKEKTTPGAKEFKTEFNIGVTNIFANPIYDLITYDYTDGYSDIFLNYPQRTSLVAGFKFHDPKGAFRLSTNVHYNKQKMKFEDSDSEKNTYSSLQTILNVGYEWHSNFNKVTIFYGFDISGGYNNYKSKRNDYEDFNESELYTITYGASPLVGINYYITSNLSLGTELKYNLAAYSGKSKSSYSYHGYPNPTTGESEYNLSGIQTYFGPLGYLSINIHF